MGKLADTAHESSISAAHLEISMLRLPLGVSEQTAPSTEPHIPGAVTAVSWKSSDRGGITRLTRLSAWRLEKENLILQGTEDWQRRTENDDTSFVFATWDRTRPTTNDDLHCGLIVRKDQSCSWHNAEVTEGQRNSKRLVVCPFIQPGTRIFEK